MYTSDDDTFELADLDDVVDEFAFDVDAFSSDEEDDYYHPEQRQEQSYMRFSVPVPQPFSYSDVPFHLPVVPVAQIGQTCKITSIATVDKFFATQLDTLDIPLYKMGQSAISIRQIAKEFGSSQGEVLEFARWEQILQTLGYNTHVHEFKSEEYMLFLMKIMSELQQGNLPLIVFSVILMDDCDGTRGHPNPRPNPKEYYEHAAIISGYSPELEEVIIVHWGMAYRVSAIDLFMSNQQLVQTRSQESYIKNLQYIKQFNIAKYLPTPNGSTTPPEKISITPAPLSGFKSKLLVAEKPIDVESFTRHRIGLFFRSESSAPVDEVVEGMNPRI